MRPTWFEFPDEPAVFGLDDQWLVGDALLVKPVTAAGAMSARVHLPGAAAGTLWYDARTYARRPAAAAPVDVPAPLDAMPVFQRGGAIDLGSNSTVTVDDSLLEGNHVRMPPSLYVFTG